MSAFLRMALVMGTVILWAHPASAVTRSHHELPTGNGHGFQIFDRQDNRITTFLEAPYRYVAPSTSARDTEGVGRRDLAHDLYFGLRVGSQATWLHDQTDIEYEEQTHVIHGSSTALGVSVDTYYFAPFGYEGNGMVMLLRLTNDGAQELSVSAFAKANMKLGQGRTEPGDEGESITWNGAASPPHGVETGPGGGHVLYVPLGPTSHVACGADAVLYNQVAGGTDVGDVESCTGNGQVIVLQQDLTVPSGGSAWWGLGVLFVNDDPQVPQAADFNDQRTQGEILEAWSAFVGDLDAQGVHAAALAEFDAWRTVDETAPAALSEDELRLWRQSETVLRMGQIREALQSNRKNHGMILAALPPGEWHTGWVRDAIYAVVALSMTGHHEEARKGLDFFLSAEGGFFSGSNYLDQDYRISACRYFGNGKEEGDFNNKGPNIETDGWGLVLWAARLYLHYSCDMDWLDASTWREDKQQTTLEALQEIVEDIGSDAQDGLTGPDASIWEVHWDLRKVFAYTVACQVRGLLDFADIARARGMDAEAASAQDLGEQFRDVGLENLVYESAKSIASHIGVAGDPAHVDGSTVEWLSWDLVEPQSEVALGTLENYSKLLTNFGGYQRLEDDLSLTGESHAGTYDTSEWILLDLRIAEAWRRTGEPGNVAWADVLVDKITEHALANDHLVPELYDRDSGDYTGVVPMVGYGAGAWMMAQLEKHGAAPPSYDAGFVHCGVTGGGGGDVSPPDEPGGGSGGSGGGETDGGVSPPASDDQAVDLGDEPAMLCSASGSGDVPWVDLWLLGLVVLALLWRARRVAVGGGV